MRRSKAVLPLFLLLPWTLAIAACQPAAETEPPAPPVKRVENAALGLVISNLPAQLEVETNEGEVLHLVPADPARGGLLQVIVDPEEKGGINLVQACKDHQAEIEARGGTYNGQRELGWQYGVAFYSRGTYEIDGQPTEETSIFVLHPTRDQRLRLVYAYPAGGTPEETRQRLEDDLFGILGELEPLQEAAAS